MTDEERAACAVCADALHAGRVVATVAWLAMATALLSTWGGASPVASPLRFGWLALVLAERGLALRVALDARLFDRLAAGGTGGLPSLALLDAALQQVLRVPTTKAGRPLAARIAGALRLLRLHVAATGLLAALAVLAWWSR